MLKLGPIKNVWFGKGFMMVRLIYCFCFVSFFSFSWCLFICGFVCVLSFNWWAGHFQCYLERRVKVAENMLYK